MLISMLCFMLRNVDFFAKTENHLDEVNIEYKMKVLRLHAFNARDQNALLKKKILYLFGDAGFILEADPE